MQGEKRKAVLQVGDTATAVVMVVGGDVEVVVARLDGRIAHLELVDGLLRLSLIARRHGCAIRLREVQRGLQELLEFLGVAELLCVEAGGQPELGEQLGVQEVVQRGDPSA